MLYRNIRFIQNQAYRTLMIRFGSAGWYLQGEKKIDHSSQCVVS
jgi:hypothetical protein